MRVNRQSSGNADGEEASRSDLGRMPLQAGTGRRGRCPTHRFGPGDGAKSLVVAGRPCIAVYRSCTT